MEADQPKATLPVVVATLQLPPEETARLEAACRLLLPASPWPVPRQELLLLVPGAQVPHFAALLVVQRMSRGSSAPPVTEWTAPCWRPPGRWV